MNPERRLGARLIKRVPVRIVLSKTDLAVSYPAEAMNISSRGLYFATNLHIREGTKLELRLKVPDEIPSLPPLECKFMGRVAHVEPLGKNGMSGVGVQFLYYSFD